METDSKKHIKRRMRYDDPIKRCIQLEREDWNFAFEHGHRNASLGIQLALKAARESKTNG